MQNSAFVQFFGEYPIIWVLDFLIENKVFDYSKTEIARQAGISRVALYQFWDRLEGLGVVRQTRTLGKSNMYTINTENEFVQELVKLDIALSKKLAESEISRAGISGMGSRGKADKRMLCAERAG